MNEGQSYVPPFELGKPLDGGAVGEVVESRANEFRVGDAVTSSRGWREYFIASPKELHPVNRKIEPLSVSVQPITDASSCANSLSISRPSLPTWAHLRRFASAEAAAAPLRRARDMFRSVRGRQIA